MTWLSPFRHRLVQFAVECQTNNIGHHKILCDCIIYHFNSLSNAFKRDCMGVPAIHLLPPFKLINSNITCSKKPRIENLRRWTVVLSWKRDLQCTEITIYFARWKERWALEVSLEFTHEITADTHKRSQSQHTTPNISNKTFCCLSKSQERH